MSFTLAMLQMKVEAGNRDANLTRARTLMKESATNDARVILLPEVMDLGWTDPSAATDATSVPDGATCRYLQDCAQEFNVYICAGMAELDGDTVYNTAVLIDPGGNILLKHRKLNELDIAHDLYAQGDRLQVCHTELGTIGIMICADGFARDLVLSRSLGYMGADIILSPSSWAVKADHDNETTPYGQLWERSYSPVAKDFSMWIAGVSNVGWIPAGPWKGMQCIGCSMAAAPDGSIAVKGSYGVDAETIIYIPIETIPRPTRGCGWDALWKSTETTETTET
jgi:predicted amidohydrolase